MLARGTTRRIRLTLFEIIHKKFTVFVRCLIHIIEPLENNLYIEKNRNAQRRGEHMSNQK